MAKGEIVHQQQFHLWPKCFQKSSAAMVSTCVGRGQKDKEKGLKPKHILLTESVDSVGGQVQSSEPYMYEAEVNLSYIFIVCLIVCD